MLAELAEQDRAHIGRQLIKRFEDHRIRAGIGKDETLPQIVIVVAR